MSLDLFQLAGRNALITGSSRGIGLALARGLATAGAHVILNGRTQSRLETAAESLRAAGANVSILPFDVTSSEETGEAIDSLEGAGTRVDILVNNAGMQYRTRLDEFPEDKWSELLRTNIDSAFHVSKHVVRYMMERGAGKIINICSVQSELGRPGIAPYAASKGALKMLTKGMCVDWAPFGIQVNGLGPGYFKTELTEALVNDAEFTAWLHKRTPAGR